MSFEAPLFSPELIPGRMLDALPEGLVFRPLQRADYEYGHLDVLRDLAHVGNITEEQWIERFEELSKCNGTYFIVVIVDQKRDPERAIIGTGTLVVERKL